MIKTYLKLWAAIGFGLVLLTTGSCCDNTTEADIHFNQPENSDRIVAEVVLQSNGLKGSLVNCNTSLQSALDKVVVRTSTNESLLQCLKGSTNKNIFIAEKEIVIVDLAKLGFSGVSEFFRCWIVHSEKKVMLEFVDVFNQDICFPPTLLQTTTLVRIPELPDNYSVEILKN
ncbi:MAG: hypothetical protein GC181_03345 [Bacteroidetes bacterium]|nr:hypothetical protein [Bacteroidota bacterium]